MPDSPFTETGFVPPAQAYRLFSLGITPPTTLGAGRTTEVTYKFVLEETLTGTQAEHGALSEVLDT